MRVERFKMEPGEFIRVRNDGELFVHPLVGYGQVNGKSIGGRKNIFHPFPGGELLEKDAEIKAVTAFDVIVATCETKHVADTASVQAKIHCIGSGTAKREVREILGFGGPAQHLRCGETVNRPGGWSSWPPHAFDHDATTQGFEEVFFVFTDPKDSYALITRKGSGYDDVVKVSSGTRVDVPLGEHPIVAAPETRLIYAWFYVGADKRYAQWAEDMGTYK